MSSIRERTNRRNRIGGWFFFLIGAVFLIAAAVGFYQAEETGPQMWRGAGGGLLGSAAMMGMGLRLLRK